MANHTAVQGYGPKKSRLLDSSKVIDKGCAVIVKARKSVRAFDVILFQAGV